MSYKVIKNQPRNSINHDSQKVKPIDYLPNCNLQLKEIRLKNS